jgi:hypothetical protein
VRFLVPDDDDGDGGWFQRPPPLGAIVQALLLNVDDVAAGSLAVVMR